jgi:hypothetical protein
LGLALGAACAATAACSSSSGNTTGGGWPTTSGGGPLGSSGGESTGGGGGGSGNASQPGGSPGGSEGTGDAGITITPDGGAGGDGASAPDGVPSGDSAGSDGGPPTFNFTLIDTNVTNIVQGSPVAGYDPIAESSTINLAVVGTTLSIRANTVPATVGSVAFALDANYTHTENAAPYMLCGDNRAGTVTSCANVLTVGKHTLTATPYSAASLGGTAGNPATLDFVIVDAADAGGQ